MTKLNCLRTARLAVASAPLALAAALAGSPALAQATTADDVTLDELVVTVRRTAERAQDVPGAISALSAEAMQTRGVDNAESLSSAVPNLQVSGPYGKVQPIFSIRGVSMSDYSSNQASPVGVYADEAYLGATYTHGLAFFDLDRLEVARGPQGTLYGRNTTGGAINLLSATTRVGDSANGYARAGYGNYGAWSLDAAAGGTVVEDRLALRGALTFEQDDGYFRNTLGGPRLAQTNYVAGRLTAQARLTDDLTTTFKFATGQSQPRLTPPYSRGVFAIPGVGLADLSGYVTPADRESWSGAQNTYGKVKVRLDLATLRFDWRLSDTLDLVSLSSWYDARYRQPHRNVDGGANRLLEIDWGSDGNAYSEDLRLSYHEDGRRAVIGAYFGREEVSLANLLHLYEDPLLVLQSADPAYAALLQQFGVIDQRLKTTKESWAAYGQVTWPLTDRLNVELGLRYTIDKSRLDYLNISRLAANGSPIGSWAPGNSSGIDSPLLPPAFAPPGGIYLSGPYTLASLPEVSVTDKAWTGRASLDYQLAEGVKAYVSYNRGYRSGSFNGGTFFGPRSLSGLYARPEFVDAYEGGIKGEFFGRRLRLNVAAFQNDYKDQQFITVVGVSTFLTNAGASRIRGMEVEMNWRVTSALRLDATLGLLDAEFKQLSLADTTSSVPGTQIDLSGNRLISAPKVSATLNADYERALANGTLRANLNANYRSHQWYSAYNDAIGYGNIEQAGYWLVNGRLTYVWADDKYAVSIWGRNLANKSYNGYAINLQAGFGLDYFQEGEPRRYGVEVSSKF